MLITRTSQSYQIKQGNDLYSCSLDFKQFRQEAKVSDKYQLSGTVYRPTKKIIFIIQSKIKTLWKI